MSPIRIVLVDDHAVVRQGLRLLLEEDDRFEVVGEADNGLSALEVVAKLKPNVVVMDLALPGLSGLDAAEQMLQTTLGPRVVFLSMHANEVHVAEALHRGASGYVLKDAGIEELVAAISAATEGRRYLSPPLSEEALEPFTRSHARPPADPLDTLTLREKQVAHMIAEGLTGKEIAMRLGISPRTVEAHHASAYRKLGVRNIAELVRVVSEARELPSSTEPRR